ncbi:6-hydroxy-D-nicotine oxidase [Daldinia childiae]|uniref:6-hydroxy-D-nicotine oxidase n=1 Tax=Daldinia childiae TaxID=326645 RepID=UPI001446003B|nr:6-hydroxy-D-nicotine oxidase [Daldinia childiae]KAF3055926.1 6-hydroxy-D-nicotine oxidase [Daldinia childiae]
MRYALLLHLALSAPAWASPVVGRAEELVSCLRSSLSPQASIVFPDDPSFANDTVRFSSYHEPTFRLVSLIANEDDARASIICAQKTETEFLFTKPGAHGIYSGFDRLKNGLQISTAKFDKIEVEATKNIMTVGGAVRFNDVINDLYAVGKNIPVGSSPCVGILGAALGGGIGRLEGLYGLIADSLLSVRIMLPNTTVVEASKVANPELFWGIRGAGVNFGFVLNATFQIYDLPLGGTTFSADFEFPLDAMKDLFQSFKEGAASMPPPLCISTYMTWSDTYNATTMKVNAAYAGPQSDGRKAIRFFSDIPALRQNFTDVPWNQLLDSAFFVNGDQSAETCGVDYGSRSSSGAAFNELTVEAHVRMTELFNYMVTKYPQMRGSDNSMYLCATQAVRALSNDATAYPWRQALGHQTWGIVYPENTTDATIEYLPQRLRATIADSAGTDGLATYIGFSRGDEPLESLFSAEHLPRLSALKKKYDPQGLFNAYHPLPTSYP